MSAPPKRKPSVPSGMISFQINADFDSEKEMINHVEVFYPGAKIKKSWTATVFRCEILIKEPKGK